MGAIGALPLTDLYIMVHRKRKPHSIYLYTKIAYGRNGNYQPEKENYMNQFEYYLHKIVKIETVNNTVFVGEVITLSDRFLTLLHRNEAETLVRYNSIASVTEIPKKVPT